MEQAVKFFLRQLSRQPSKRESLVREYKQQGMDFIKVYNLLSREVYLAIIDEAKRQKIPVAGHVPFSMTAAGVSDLGQLSIEHFTDIFFSVSRDEDAIREERRQELAKGLTIRPANPLEPRAAATYNEQKAAALAARFGATARGGVRQLLPAVQFRRNANARATAA
jgi:hypothetical protein